MRTEDQNSTLGFPIFADDAAAIGSVPGKTGLTITATLAKNGGSAYSVTPSYIELGGGNYWVIPIAAHRDTIGCNVWQFSASGAVIAPVFERIRQPPFAVATDRVKLHATQSDYAPAKAGDEMALTPTVLTALFADVDTGALVASIVAQFDEATDLPADTIATLAASRTVTALATLISDAAAAKTAAQSADGKLSAGRLSRVDRLPDVDPGSTGGLALHGETGGGGVDHTTQLNRIEAQTSKLSGSPVTVNGAVKPGGQIVLKHGDNHLVSLLNSVSVPVDDVGGSLHTLMAAVGVNNIGVAAIRGADPASRISGTVAALNYASNILTVTMEFTAAETAKGVVGPVYTYDVYRLDNPTRTYFSGKLTVTRDARP